MPTARFRKVLSRRIPIRDHSGQVVMYQDSMWTSPPSILCKHAYVGRNGWPPQGRLPPASHTRSEILSWNWLDHLPLLDDTAPDDARRPDLEVILQETKRLDRIVNQIIDYARPQGDRGVRLRHGTAGA